MSKIRRVLSFDVGIINLAYCILEINDEEQRFKILKWGIINLADNRETCEFIINTGAICDKIAKHSVIVDEHNKKYYCKAHVNKAKLCIKNVSIKWWEIPSDDVERCCYEDCKKSGESYCNILSGQYCKLHQKKVMSVKNLICATKKCNNHVTHGLYLSEPMYHYDNDEVCREKIKKYKYGLCEEHHDEEYKLLLTKKTKKMPQNSNDISINIVGAAMYKYLDLIPELLQVDDVLIENQPTIINPHMKAISSTLYAYFIMRGIHEKEKTNSTIKNIDYCSPSNKIKVGGATANKKIENTEEEKVYTVTKNLAISFCKALISDNDEWVQMLESNKKKDDMADAFLQGFIMNFHNKIPEYYAQKIRTVNIDDEQKEPVKRKQKKPVKRIKPITNSNSNSNSNSNIDNNDINNDDDDDVDVDDGADIIKIGSGAKPKQFNYRKGPKRYYKKKV